MQIICRVFHTCAKLFGVSLLFGLIHQSHSSFMLFCYFYFLFHNNRTLTFANIIFLFQNILLKKYLQKPNTPKTEQTFPLVFLVHDKKPNKPLYLKKLIYSPTPTIFLKNSATLFNYPPPQKRPHRVKSFYKFCIQSPYSYL